MNLAELLMIPASMFPDTEILVCEDTRLTYADLAERAAAVAMTLTEAGVGPGDRVALLDIGGPPGIATLFGCAAAGAVFVPLNFRARDHEIGQMLELVQPKIVLAGEAYLDRAGERGMPLDDVHAGPGAELLPAEVADDDMAALVFTSGTSAAAKAVMLAHADLVNFVFGMADAADGEDHGTVLIAAPLPHVAGLTAVLTATWAGRRMVVMRQFEAGEWLRIVQGERVTHAFLVPTMLKHVLDHPSFAGTDLSSLQVLSYGGAPMPISVIRRAIEALPQVQFINAFGQTETSSTVTILGPEDHQLTGIPEEDEMRLRRLASIGRPLPDVEVAIFGEDGQPLGAGQVGEIAIRTNRLMRGYYGQEAATAATLRDGWLYTRDLGWLDEDGYVFLAGRKSDMIIRGGENIAPEEVEVVLETHPAVDEAAVFGIPDEEWGERVAAAVVLRAGAAAADAELMEFVRGRLGGYKTPASVVFLETLPRNDLGKLLRKDLRARYSED
ncbi:MAG: AMP-binding protein [Chloroflexi bacterium]|nr:AMP-binding protein [Chloroflexota bacterium]